jgi:uncharacterized membrane protein YbhN (UPF0104 family)
LLLENLKRINLAYRNNNFKRWSIALAQLCFSTSLLSYLFYHFNFTETQEIISTVGGFNFFFCTFLLAVLIVPASIRWRWFVARSLDKGQKSISLLGSIRANTVNVALNQVLPSTIGGDLYRVFLAKSWGLSIRASVLATLGDRVSALIILLILAGPAIIIVVVSIENLSKYSQENLSFAFTTLLCFLLGASYFFRKHKYLGTVSSLFNSLLINSNANCLFTRVFLTSLIIHLVTLFVMTLITITIGIEFDLFITIGILAVSLLVSRLPISVAGWGVREGVSVSLFAASGVPADLALAMSIIFGLTELFAAILGLVVLFTVSVSLNFFQHNHDPETN